MAWWKLILLGLALGLGGSLYNRALVGLKTAESRLPLPRQVRILPPMLLAGLLFFLPARSAWGRKFPNPANGQRRIALGTLFLLLTVKSAFSLLSFTGDAPGGILMPILCVGALSGLAGAFILEGVYPSPATICWLVWGMAGFFAAVLGTPLVSLVLVMEITGASACLPSGRAGRSFGQLRGGTPAYSTHLCSAARLHCGQLPARRNKCGASSVIWK